MQTAHLDLWYYRDTISYIATRAAPYYMPICINNKLHGHADDKLQKRKKYASPS
jgi:hypothetical protein